MARTPDQNMLDQLVEDVYRRDEWGAPAQYIPELAGVRPEQFAVAIALADGRVLCAGETHSQFTIQSISKVFSLSIALGRIGEGLWKRVGREPSGNPFDSIQQLELEKGKPRNPFINPGAIVTTDALLSGHAPRETLSEIMHFVRMAGEDDDIHINKRVALSEKATGHRNMAVAYYLRSYGNLEHAPEMTLGVYFHQCAIEMNVVQLAKAGRYLAGIGGRLISARNVRSVNALMMTCGQYDGSGDFAYRVGLPSKSGVGGGLLVIAPGQGAIALWSPGLNSFGNSLAGTFAAERLVQQLDWRIF